MTKFILDVTDLASEDLSRLPREIQKRIRDKIDFFLASENPLHYAETLNEFEAGDYRFKIGHYRASFDVIYTQKTVVLKMLKIKHRKDMYRKK